MKIPVSNKELKELEVFIKDMLSTNIKWAERALVCLYNKQTTEEKLFRDSGIKNGVGFNKHDSWVLTPIIQNLLEKKKYNNYTIPYNERPKIFKRVPKYWKQILELSILKSRKLNMKDLELIYIAYHNYLKQIGLQQTFL